MGTESSYLDNLPHRELTEKIIACVFEVANTLGRGYLESVYHSSLEIVLKENGLRFASKVPMNVEFRNVSVGHFIADMVVENTVLLELKSCSALAPEHQAQAINYLKMGKLPVGLLINFGSKSVEIKRLHH